MEILVTNKMIQSNMIDIGNEVYTLVMLKELNHLKSNESSALVLKIPATTATILPNCETIIVERDRYRVQSRFLRINETDTESSLGFWESMRPIPSPVSVFENQRDRDLVSNPQKSETSTRRDRDEKSRRSLVWSNKCLGNISLVKDQIVQFEQLNVEWPPSE